MVYDGSVIISLVGLSPLMPWRLGNLALCRFHSKHLALRKSVRDYVGCSKFASPQKSKPSERRCTELVILSRLLRTSEVNLKCISIEFEGVPVHILV